MKKTALAFGSVLCLMTLMINCSGNKDLNAAGRNGFTYIYTTSSTKGDFADWTFNGTDLRGDWQSLDANGVINFSLSVQAACPNYNATYNYYTCTVNSASSTCAEGPGADNCSSLSTLSLKVLESPGSSISVQAAGFTNNQQLFTGFAKNVVGCGVSIAGDYVFISGGLGQTKIFGLQRVDADFLSVNVAEFGLKAAGPSNSVTVQYLSENASGSGAATFSDSGCLSGVRTRTAGGVAARVLTTTSGLMVSDRTSPQAGAIAVRTDAVATLTLLQNRTLTGFMYADNGTMNYIKIVTGSASGTVIAITAADINGTPLSGIDIRALSSTTTATTAPAYPNFTAAPDASPNSAYTYSGNSLVSTYINPGSFTGSYRIDGFTTNDRIIFTAAVDRDKMMIYGVGYSWKLTSDTPPPGVTYPVDGYYSSSSLYLFEK